nr:hypothetical protein CFP56_30277 [Quercus suber]
MCHQRVKAFHVPQVVTQNQCITGLRDQKVSKVIVQPRSKRVQMEYWCVDPCYTLPKSEPVFGSYAYEFSL